MWGTMNKTRTESKAFMEKQNSQTTHMIILLGAFVIGLALRMIRLGALPLTHMEAEFALQALGVAQRGEVLFGGHIAYVGLTGIHFFLFSPNNFLARFWPAFFGALVILIPYLFRKSIGKWPAILAGSILAISPEMVGLSRIVGSPMMAMVFLMLFAGFWLQKKPVLAGLCLGVGLMSGPGFWIGVLILGLSFIFAEGLFGIRQVFNGQAFPAEKPFWIRFALSFVVTLLLVGTGFFMAPAGLSGIFSGLYTFILGFGTHVQAPFGIIPFALVAYSIGAVIFGLWGGIRGILVKSKLDMFLFLWAGFGLIFIILYPRAGPADLVWVTLPLWILGARVVVFAWRVPETSRLVVTIMAALVVVVFAFMLLALRTLVMPTLTSSEQINYLIALVGGVVLLVAILLLVSYGWTEEIARAGLLLGLALVFSAGMISISVNSTGIGPEKPYELWYSDQPALTMKFLNVTIDRILVWNARGQDPVDIVVSGLDVPGLRWALGGYESLDFVPFVPPQSQPGVLITTAGVIPEISRGYQGQGLVWLHEVPWRELSPNQYLTWLVTRDVPILPQELILWVRTDLMPGGEPTQ
jgi:4-amino-4-deoxy-L-arabinose transferase-like glycosyltransferase